MLWSVGGRQVVVKVTVWMETVEGWNCLHVYVEAQ